MALPFGVVGHIAVNVTTTSAELLAANPDREYAIFINDSDTVIYLAFGEDAVINSGVRINATGGSYEMARHLGNLNQLVVNAIHAGSGNKKCVGLEGD